MFLRVSLWGKVVKHAKHEELPPSPGSLGPYRGQTLQELNGKSWQRRVMFVVDVLRQNSNEVVPVGT